MYIYIYVYIYIYIYIYIYVIYIYIFFSPDLCCLPCHVLFCGGDTNAPSSCFLQFNAL